MIDKDKAIIYIHSTKHPLYNWSQEELDQKVAEFIQAQDSYDFKLVVVYVVYNEEDFLEDSLNSCLNFNDLDGIYLLDGAWKGVEDSPISTDNTKSIIQKFQKEHPNIKIVFEQPTKIWETQPQKRTHSLVRVEEIWGKSYTIMKDGDEVIKFYSGKDNIWLKKEIAGMWPAVGIVDSFAYGSDRPMLGARIIPTGQGIHYDSERNMIIHDKNCKIICDYNIDHQQFVDNGMCFIIKYMFHVNYWNARNLKRMEIKDNYAEIIKGVREKNEYTGCIYEHNSYKRSSTNQIEEKHV